MARLALIVLLLASALVAPSAHANVLPDDYESLLATGSITVSAPDPSFIPGMDPYDAHWLARLLHGQAYLVRFTEYSYAPRDTWLIVAPMFIPRTGGRSGPPGWCGIAFIFIDAKSSAWFLTVAVGQRPASIPLDCR